MSDIDFGHDPEPITKVICAKCGRDIDANGAHVPRWQEKAKAEEAEARVRIVATLRPYAGAIAQCQVGAITNDRAAIYYRCSKRPKYIRETRDGPLAVCSAHGRSWSASRYRGEKKWGTNQPPADEPIDE